MSLFFVFEYYAHKKPRNCKNIRLSTYIVSVFFRNVINDVQQKTSMLQHAASQVGGGGGGGEGAHNPLVFHELKDGLNNVQNDISKLLSRPMVSLMGEMGDL